MDSSKPKDTFTFPGREKGNNLPVSPEELIKRVEELDQEVQERFTKEAAILFTDISGSTTYFKIHGDIAGRLMMQRHFEMLSPIVSQCEGTIVKTVGDAIMASFDDPYQAVRSAIVMQKTLLKYNVTLPEDDRVRIRIGINFGKVIKENDDVYGNVVNEASKLVSLGAPGQIVVSESVYEALHLREDIIFTPFETDHSSENNVEFPAYTVKWLKDDFIIEQELTLVSLTFPTHTATPGEGEILPELYFSPIEHLIKEKTIKTMIPVQGKLYAFFKSAETATATALEMFRLLQTTDQLFTIGIHTGTITVIEDEVYGANKADEVQALAEKNEIYITQPTYERIKNNPSFILLPLSTTLPGGGALYKILCEPLEKRRIEEPNTLTHKNQNPECFYCSSRNHPASACPSKSIPYHTHSLNEIGYLSPADIKSSFETFFPRILNAYKPDHDEIIVPLISDANTGFFKISFESFYEVTEIFQLRFLREVWRTEASHWNNFVPSVSSKRGGGYLWLGEDSLRVSKYGEASAMLHKALEHDREDYRPYLALGFISAETQELSRAAQSFRKALIYATTPLQKSYISLLLSRIYEIQCELDEAIEAVRDSLVYAPHFLEAKYRHAVLLGKKGEKHEAISTLRNLIATEPSFYIRVLIDPGLNSLRSEIDLLTKELYEQARAQAADNIKSIEKSLKDHGEWFSKDDPEYQAAETIFSQTIKLFEGKSYFGFLDVVAYGFNIKDKLRTALKNRRKALRKNINSFHAAWEDYHHYLQRFCYKNLISAHDSFLADHFMATLEKAKTASSIESAESLKIAQQVIHELNGLAQKMISNKKKLAFLQKLYFTFECSFKFAFFFFAWSTLVTILFSIVLMGYQAYSQSLHDFTKGIILDYFKFSSFCGTLFGAGAGIYWIYRNFDQLYEKLR